MRPIDADRTKESIPETSVDIFENCARCGLLDREQVFDLIDEQPTIEPKNGKWEDVEADEGEWICFKCSECGHDAYSYTGEILSNEWKFCPYCGARMERSEE